MFTSMILMLAASMVACMKPGKEDGIVNYDYAD